MSGKIILDININKFFEIMYVCNYIYMVYFNMNYKDLTCNQLNI